MNKVDLKKKQHQEQQLDRIESMLKGVLHQVQTYVTAYSPSDVAALWAAYRALQAVTLLSDQELEQLKLAEVTA